QLLDAVPRAVRGEAPLAQAEVLAEAAAGRRVEVQLTLAARRAPHVPGGEPVAVHPAALLADLAAVQPGQLAALAEVEALREAEAVPEIESGCGGPLGVTRSGELGVELAAARGRAIGTGVRGGVRAVAGVEDRAAGRGGITHRDESVAETPRVLRALAPGRGPSGARKTVEGTDPARARCGGVDSGQPEDGHEGHERERSP